ncbi:hypothetical protein [Flavobacterium sp. N1994]|uniref:hypothetical protein n=1 Tax=Flavobacterium sp. N1994 TaxID=2986827 RepID=UPI0022218632|nr:hypothetical protein [Flavobacterium sp. N1994]
MKTFRIICFIASIALIGIHFYEIDYNNLSSSENKNHYLGIASMTMIGFLFLTQIIKERKKE